MLNLKLENCIPIQYPLLMRLIMVLYLVLALLVSLKMCLSRVQWMDQLEYMR